MNSPTRQEPSESQAKTSYGVSDSHKKPTPTVQDQQAPKAVPQQNDQNASGQGTAAQGVEQMQNRQGETPSYQNGIGVIPSSYGQPGGMVSKKQDAEDEEPDVLRE